MLARTRGSGPVPSSAATSRRRGAAPVRPGVPAALAVIALVALVLGLAGCAGSSAAANEAGDGSRLRLGYFANLTHAPAVLGIADGHFQQALGATRLETQVFNAGPAAVEALLAGSLDAAFLGPAPAINASAKSDGEAIRIVAGATSGGASFVVRPGLTTGSLAGTTVADPQLGGTQDVAVRSWLEDHGYATSLMGDSDVTVAPQSNAQTLQLYRSGQIDGAWLPEPWAARLRLEAGAVTLVDERDLWPGGAFATTELAVSTAYLEAHPEQVRALLTGLVATNDAIAADPEAARDRAGAALDDLTGLALPAPVLAGAWANLTFTTDPVPGSLAATAEAAHRVGLASSVPDLSRLLDLRLLNDVLRAAGRPAVSAAGLGKD